MNLCYELGSRLYGRRLRTGRMSAVPTASPEDYWQWQFDTSPAYFAKFWDLTQTLPGRRVLDIGCGLGGRAAYLATCGPREVVGCDINVGEIENARRLAKEKLDARHAGGLSFAEVREGELPELAPFDIVLLVDSLEHVRDPVEMLNVAYSLTRPGGLCYFGTTGWYHYAASHVLTILPVPFLTVFFSDRTIIEAVRRVLRSPYYVRTMWDSDPPVARWEGVTTLGERPGEYLNKITVRTMSHAIKASNFESGELRVLGFSWRQAPALRLLNFLAKIPGIREMYHSGCFGRLERAT